MSGARDVSRLPQWAQTLIGNLESEVASLRAERAAGPEDTDTWVDHVALTAEGDDVRWQALPRGAEVVFWDQDGYPSASLGRVQVSWQDGALEVRTSGSGGHMVIQPIVSNVVRIHEAPHRAALPPGRPPS